jgi:flagellar biogenesis protein FliO
MMLLALAVCLAPLSFAQEGASGPQPTAAAAAAESIPFKRDEALGGQIARVAMLFVAIAAVFVGGAFIYKRRFRLRRAHSLRRLKVVETLRLTPKTALFLIEFDDSAFLVGQHGERLHMLAERPKQSQNEHGQRVPSV